MVDRVQTSEINHSADINGVVQKSLSIYLKWQKAQRAVFIQTVRRGSCMRSVQCCTKWLVLVTVCVCVCVWGGGGGSEFSGAWGKRGEGGQGQEFSFLTAWWMKLSFSLLVLAWRIRSLLPDGSRLKKLCVGWVGSPAMQRALRVRRVL